MNDLEKLSDQAKNLLSTAGLNPSIISLQSCTRGGNNRTFRLETPDATYALKEYFRQENDKRDRLQSEYAFLTYANVVAPKMTPFAYAKDDNAGIALYEFIEGESLAGLCVSENDVKQAANFFCALNGRKRDMANLPNASEACFSIQEHLNLINTRIQNLTKINIETAEDDQAQQTIQTLSERWLDVQEDVQNGAAKYHLALNEPLALQNRCLSPSDFGFHNALRTTNGELCFLDFEYAGWDDPAKMVGDFFSQLAVPVPAEYFDLFTKSVMQSFPDAVNLEHRAQLLRKVYEVKWCCIALNVFIPVNLARRMFANPTLNVVDLKKAQLAKADTLIQRLEIYNHA